MLAKIRKQEQKLNLSDDCEYLAALAPLVAFGHGKERPLKINFGHFGCLWSLKIDTPKKFTLALWLSLVMEKRDTKKIRFGCLWSSKRETP